jgi:hypothetical protein
MEVVDVALPLEAPPPAAESAPVAAAGEPASPLGGAAAALCWLPRVADAPDAPAGAGTAAAATAHAGLQRLPAGWVGAIERRSGARKAIQLPGSLLGALRRLGLSRAVGVLRLVRLPGRGGAGGAAVCVARQGLGASRVTHHALLTACRPPN